MVYAFFTFQSPRKIKSQSIYMNVQIFKADFIVWLKIACSLHHPAI